MDEAEKYQQRLQAIAERRRRQEEEERLTRETEEEWLKTAQEKAGTDEDEQQVNKDAEDHFSIQMAQRTFHESGQEGRSVLGMLAVQVERDPKTGATVVRSVAPVSSPAGAPTATTVFDDGRKSIHAVGGSGSQPSTEELGQILSFVDGVGMKVLLDEVALTPNQEEMEMERVDASRAPKGQVVSFSTRRLVSKEDDTQLDSSRSDDLEAEPGIEECSASMGQEEDNKEDGSIMAVRDIAGEVGNVEDLRLEEGPVTLVFLGYTDGDQGGGQEDHEGMLTAERVIITEEGEEHVLGPETSASPQEGKESRLFHDVPLDGTGAGVEVQGQNGDDGRQNSSSPSKATSKRKTCRCCSVM
ncbi:paralemmin-1-like isoform X2 [Cebidichthys violaceus]|uniref:paralemmin-1-like isoform X2 n=1 Tax=Cebidichthys violaceus TaxID=271503 RepID=UPI0035CB7552